MNGSELCPSERERRLVANQPYSQPVSALLRPRINVAELKAY